MPLVNVWQGYLTWRHFPKILKKRAKKVEETPYGACITCVNHVRVSFLLWDLVLKDWLFPNPHSSPFWGGSTFHLMSWLRNSLHSVPAFLHIKAEVLIRSRLLLPLALCLSLSSASCSRLRKAALLFWTRLPRIPQLVWTPCWLDDSGNYNPKR